MPAGVKDLDKGQILFREGDPSDAMYVIKSGRLAILKNKGNSEIVLAELGPGDMLGEMAFFDNKPRSAGAKAIDKTTVIELPFKALHAQFKTFPEWLRAVVKTVNNHLRMANQRIKNLERLEGNDAQVFQPHLITRLIMILAYVANRYGEDEEGTEGVVVPAGMLRRHCIQIHQQPTHKMQILLTALDERGYMTVEDLGEGRQKITVKDVDELFDFVEFYNDWLFKDDSKRTTIDRGEVKILQAFTHFGKNYQPDSKGNVKVNLTGIQSHCPNELGFKCDVSETDSLTEKGVIGDKISEEARILVEFNYDEIARLYRHWKLIYDLNEYQA